MGDTYEAKFKAIYEQAMQLAGVLDTAGILLEVNSTAQRFVGTTKEALIGRPFWETPWWTHSPEAQEQLKDAISRAAAGETLRFETTHQDVNGELRLIDFSIKPVRDRRGRVFCLLPEGRDITDCRRAQQLAEVEQANLLAMFDAAPFGIAVFDGTGKALRTNDGLQRLFEAAPAEERLLRGGVLTTCRHRAAGRPDADCSWCRLGEALAAALERDAAARDLQVRIEKDLGSPGPEWIQCNITPVTLDKVPHALLTVFDITEQKHAEQRLWLFFEQTIFSVTMIDEQGRVVEWNRAAEVLSGLSRPQVLGRYYWDVLFEMLPPAQRSEERRQANERAIREALRVGAINRPSPHLVTLNRPDGSQRVIEESNFPIRTPRGFRFGSIAHDVTARSQAEAARTISEERYRIAALLTGQLIYDYAINPGTIQWAGAVQAITGYSPEEFAQVGVAGWEEMIHPDDREAALGSLQRAISTRVTFHSEYRLRRKDGRYITIEDTGGLVLAEDGRPQRMVGAMKDITDRCEAKRQHQILENQLQQAMKMQAVGRLAGGVAHDFNNLLTCIAGNTSFVLMDLPEDHPHAELLREVELAADSAAELTRQLLAFSRKQLIEPRLLELNELIRNLERMIGRLIGEDIVLSSMFDAKPCPVLVDPGQLERILVNLAVNARDAMPSGGRLLICTANVYLGAGEIQQGAPGHYVALSVSDTGSGIAPEVKEHLFEPFFTTKGLGRGTGLGLATTYGAVQQAGGFIEVDTAPGGGTTFRIFLPRGQGQLEPRAQVALSGELGGDETILVVEDDKLVRALTVRTLTRYGYQVLAASSAAEALQLASAHDGDIHLLLTDVVMPESNGRQLAAKLSERLPALAVLYLSGYTDDVVVHHGVLEPGIALLAKPFTPVSLAQKVRETLDKRSKTLASGS